jgi:hypothetical protein
VGKGGKGGEQTETGGRCGDGSRSPAASARHVSWEAGLETSRYHAEEKQDENDYEDQAEAAAGGVSPVFTVAPRGQGADKE